MLGGYRKAEYPQLNRSQLQVVPNPEVSRYLYWALQSGAHVARGCDVVILLGQQAFDMFTKMGLVEVVTSLSLETRNHPWNC